MRTRAVSTIILCLFFVCGIALSQPQATPGQNPAAAAPKNPAEAPKAPPVEKPLSTTRHTVTIDGKPVPYTATVGELVVGKPNEEPGASVFFVAYTRGDVKDKSGRPLMFLFHGGPGSSTVWLPL